MHWRKIAHLLDKSSNMIYVLGNVFVSGYILTYGGREELKHAATFRNNNMQLDKSTKQIQATFS